MHRKGSNLEILISFYIIVLIIHVPGKPSSKYFDMKLLLTLMIDLQLSPAVSEEMHALILLNEYLHTLARSNNGHLSDQVFGVDWDQICGVYYLFFLNWLQWEDGPGILIYGHSLPKEKTSILKWAIKQMFKVATKY